LVGDQAKLSIEATIFNKNIIIKWPALPDTFNSLEIVEKGKIDTVQEGAHIKYKQTLLITGFDSGSFKIPAFAFNVQSPDRGNYTLYTDSFRLNVSTVPVDTTKPFQPIKEIVEVKITWRDYIWLIVGAAIFLLLAGLVIFYFIRHKKTPIPAFIPKAPSESLEERTLRELAELDEQQLWQKDKVKEYYSNLTDILRTYLEERFSVSAKEQTTDEILQQVRRNPLMSPYYERLATILSTADMAKFAKAQPLPHEHTACMEMTREIVKDAQPVTKETITEKES